MKKIFLLAVLLFPLTFAFGQERGYKKTNWTSYRAFPCFPNLYISIRSVGYEPLVKKYEYQFRIKNNSTKNVHFNLKILIKKSNEGLMAGRFDVRAGQEYTHETSYANAVPEPNTDGFFNSTVTGYLENDKDDWTLPSYSCNNGVKVCDQNCNTKAPIKDNKLNSQNNNTTSPANNSNTSIAPQNDLTEYNRSKADLERQMNEKSAEGQQKSQNYTQAMNSGITAHNSGNYDEAKKQFSIALNNCNTEEARVKAKEYYDKTINAEKSQYTISAVKSIEPTLMNIAKSIDDANAIKRENEKRKFDELMLKVNHEKKKEMAEHKQDLIDAEEKNDYNSQKRLFNYYSSFYPNYNIDNSLSEYYCKKILSNPAITEQGVKAYTIDLLNLLMLNGKKEEALDLICGKYFDKKGFDFELVKAVLYRKDYFSDASDFKPGPLVFYVDLLNKISLKYDEEKVYILLQAYYKVTGEFDSLGIAKNEKEGLDIINKYQEPKSKYPKYDKEYQTSSYYLGLLYFNGTGTIKKDPKKAFKLFNIACEEILSESSYSQSLQYYLWARNGFLNFRIDAYNKLCYMLREGIGTSKNNQKASEMISLICQYKSVISASDRTSLCK